MSVYRSQFRNRRVSGYKRLCREGAVSRNLYVNKIKRFKRRVSLHIVSYDQLFEQVKCYALPFSALCNKIEHYRS